ncbi:hypothetical protein ACFXJ8_39250 [Nonomuraea sp. NPDC059194]|uniref:hypothetical protein n=1 Tax=Nonomuraea sp. NPDC059194 TaxID=3346764 RepID=UPI0036A3EC9A
MVRWRGTVVVTGLYDHTDLDSAPPRSARDLPGADIVGDWIATTLKAADGRVRLARLGEASPSWRTCRDAAAAEGGQQVERVQAGDVLCALTSDGRVALLRVVAATQLTSPPQVRMKVTVWDPPAAPGT